MAGVLENLSKIQKSLKRILSDDQPFMNIFVSYSRLSVLLIVDIHYCRCSLFIIRPHRSTTYIDAAFCYPPSSVVCLSAGQTHQWALQKRLNRSRCSLGRGLRWTQETMYSTGIQIPRGKGHFWEKGFRILAALLHGSQVVGVSQTLLRWTESATHVRQGDHHVGHSPTF